MKNKIIYSYFTDDDFLKISNAIKEAEKSTAGEIRVSIKEKVPLGFGTTDIRKIAEKEFYKLKMNETRDATGILLLLILEQRSFYILADSGIHEKVGQTVWDNVRDKIQEDFRKGKFTEGIIKGVKTVGEILAKHFPIKPDDTNELSNEVAL
jgi:uncharacterized membrane protein